MQQENKVVDPEIERIKQQLVGWAIVAVTACIVLPFGLPLYVSATIIMSSPICFAYFYFKFKEKRISK